MIRKMAVLIVVLGVVVFVIGGVFIGEAINKQSFLTSSMRQEKITLGLTPAQIAAGDVVDTAAEAQAVADKVRADRHAIAATYTDLLAASGGRYDPTSKDDLAYTQALNLENYLYTAVLSFGVIQETFGTGAVLVIIGILFGATGMVLRRLGSTLPSAELR
jgi:hypothetical protein